MSSSLIAISMAASLLAQPAAAAIPTVFFPLNYYYGPNHKISTDLVTPFDNTTIEVVFDTGSENFWVFGPNATNNWGKTCLGCQGQCNATVSPFYNWPDSPTAAAPDQFSTFYAYGAYTKIVQGSISVNDTFAFTNVAGQSTVVPDVRVAVESYMQQRLGDGGQCIPAAYDLAILGVAPYQVSPSWNTTGPSVRKSLLDSGAVGAPVISMWMDEAPADTAATYTGGALFGGIETSKYSGELVKVPLLTSDSGPPSVGYYVPVPQLHVNGVTVNTSDTTTRTCLLDSGTQVDDLPVSFGDEAEKAFMNASGLTRSPIGRVAWPGDCNSIPANLTVDLEWAGVEAGKSVTVKVPVRNYVRANGAEVGYCTLNMDFGGCLLAAPFFTAAFLAADDAAGEIALAQGGVSVRGSGVDEAAVVATIP
jgi:hypothetical protein